MSILGTQTKQPVDRLDYDIDFSDWLVGTDSIVSVTVAIDKPGLISPFQTWTRNIVKVWLEAGLDGEAYKVTVDAETADGRIKQSEFKVKVKDT